MPRDLHKTVPCPIGCCWLLMCSVVKLHPIFTAVGCYRPSPSSEQMETEVSHACVCRGVVLRSVSPIGKGRKWIRQRCCHRASVEVSARFQVVPTLTCLENEPKMNDQLSFASLYEQLSRYGCPGKGRS